MMPVRKMKTVLQITFRGGIVMLKRHLGGAMARGVGAIGKNVAKNAARGAVKGMTNGLFGSGAYMPPPPPMPRLHNTSRHASNNSALKLANGVTKSLLSHNSCNHSHNNSFGNAMGSAIGTAIGSAIMMSVGNAINEKHQDYMDRKAAERQAEMEARAAKLRAEQEAKEAELQAKKEAAFHAMNRNMPGYTEELGRNLMNAEGLSEEELKNYPTKCPSCFGAPDGTRYCPFCGTKLV